MLLYLLIKNSWGCQVASQPSRHDRAPPEGHALVLLLELQRGQTSIEKWCADLRVSIELESSRGDGFNGRPHYGHEIVPGLLHPVDT